MTARDRLVIVIVALAAALAASWFLVLSPQRKESSKLATEIATEQETLDSALSDLAAGVAARRTYARDYATVARLGTAVPDDDNVASLIVQIQQAASAAKIDFRSLKVGETSAAGTQAPLPPTPTTGAPATQAATATLPPGTAVGAAGFPTEPFSFEFRGNFFHLAEFMSRLQRFLVVRNRVLAVHGRFMTLDGIALDEAPRGFPEIKATVSATTYLLPPSQGLTNGATPAGPTATATAAPSSASPVPTPTATAISPVR